MVTRNLTGMIAFFVIILPSHQAAAGVRGDIPQPKGCGPATAGLISPANETTLTRLDPTFTFQPVSDVNEYRVEVSTKSDLLNFDAAKK